jgi:hypothetical protein
VIVPQLQCSSPVQPCSASLKGPEQRYNRASIPLTTNFSIVHVYSANIPSGVQLTLRNTAGYEFPYMRWRKLTFPNTVFEYLNFQKLTTFLRIRSQASGFHEKYSWHCGGFRIHSAAKWDLSRNWIGSPWTWTVQLLSALKPRAFRVTLSRLMKTKKRRIKRNSWEFLWTSSVDLYAESRWLELRQYRVPLNWSVTNSLWSISGGSFPRPR